MKFPSERHHRTRAADLIQPAAKESNPYEPLQQEIEQMWQPLFQEYQALRVRLEKSDYATKNRRREVPDSIVYSLQLLMHDICVLYPQKRGALQMDDLLWNAMKDLEAIDGIIKGAVSQLALVSRLRFLFPDRREPDVYPEYMIDERKAELQQEMRTLFEQQRIPEALGLGVDLLIVFPDDKHELPLQMFTHEQGEEWVRNLREQKIMNNQTTDDVKDALTNFAGYRILFPDRQQYFHLDAIVPIALARLKELKTRFITNYAHLAANLSILTAEDVQVDRQGIHLIHRAEQARPAPLPDRSIV